MKKICFGALFLFTSLAISSSAEANYYVPPPNYYLPSQNCDVMYSNDCGYPMECQLPWYTVYLDVEFLYWKARVDGMPFAGGGVPEGSVTTSTPPGRTREVDYRWDPGFRVGGGFLFGCDWDLSLEYTWFRTRANGFFNDPTDQSISTIFGATIGTSSADWDFRFQTIELNLRKDFCFCSDFLLEPTLGLEAAYIKDQFSVTRTAAASVILTSSNTQKFWAFGPKMGFNTIWNLCPNFGLFAGGAIGGYWGDYSIHRIDINRGDAGTSTLVFVDTEYRFSTLVLVPQYCFGIEWNQDFCCSQYHLRVLAAWEEQFWLNQNQLFYGPASFDALLLNRNSNLTLYGLTLKAQLFF